MKKLSKRGRPLGSRNSKQTGLETKNPFLAKKLGDVDLIYEYRRNSEDCRRRHNVAKGMHLHHTDIEMIDRDPQRYVQFRDEDIVVLTREEHIKLHAKLRKDKKK